MNWDEYFINIAEQVKLKSKDKRTQIGVVVVGKDNEIVSTGYNSFARGINDNLDERQERPEKYFWFEHAERNSIFAAAFGEDPEFFEFYRSLYAYEKAITGSNSTMVMSPTSEFFNYFKSEIGAK